jgi:hypothetical protein
MTPGHLTVKLSGRARAPDWSRGRTLSSRARGDTADCHSPLQRWLEDALIEATVRARNLRCKRELPKATNPATLSAGTAATNRSYRRQRCWRLPHLPARAQVEVLNEGSWPRLFDFRMPSMRILVASSNGEVEAPADHVSQAPRPHHFSRVPRRLTTHASRPPPTMVRRRGGVVAHVRHSVNLVPEIHGQHAHA